MGENVGDKLKFVKRDAFDRGFMACAALSSRAWMKEWLKRYTFTPSVSGSGPVYLRVPRPTMNNRAILEGATSLTPPSIAFSSIQFSTGKCWSH
ncbi:hypothetical protein DPMN_039556 [Dreissena polymorpha]|uniref:Uncharacterized protein n=1 Tax=Dreissena polymorpha TaxID=45954 RepID=A0A9D4CW68_DREPO|nr:hypothetical protein DPMN_039556 [Dreissena polymorpha]